MQVKLTVGRLYMEIGGIALIHFIIFIMLWFIPDFVEDET